MRAEIAACAPARGACPASDAEVSCKEIKRIRTKLGLTQEAAGELIGGGPRAFQRYEAGDLLPSRAIGSALALLDRDPSGLLVLQERSNAS